MCVQIGLHRLQNIHHYIVTQLTYLEYKLYLKALGPI